MAAAKPSQAELDRQKLVDNERLKLLAGAFDRIGTTIAALALIAPTVGLIYDTGDFRSRLDGSWGFTLTAWLGAIVALHVAAQLVLGKLK